MKKPLLAIVFSCAFICQCLYGQWQAYTFTSSKNNIFDIALQGKSFTAAGQFTFFGSAESPMENVVRTGIDPFRIQAVPATLNRSGEWLSWAVPLKTPVAFTPGNALSGSLNLYTRNIRSVEVWVKQTGGNWAGREVPVRNEKYSGLTEFTFSGKETRFICQPGGGDPAVAFNGSSAITIDEVVLIANKKNPAEPATCIIGESQLFQRSGKKEPAKAMFLYEYTGNPENKPEKTMLAETGDAYPFAQLTSYVNFSPTGYEFVPDSNFTEEQQYAAFFNLIRLVFKQYPYYKEHGSNPEYFKKELEKIIASVNDFNTKLKQVQALVWQFHDGHFRLDLGNEEKKSVGPVLARSFKDGIYVSAVFDESLKPVCAPGMKILSVNTVPVKKYLDSLSAYEYGDSVEQAELSVSRMFYGKANDSVRVELADGSGNRSAATLRYSGKVNVPEQFRPRNFQFFTKDNWGYLRINNWNMGSWVNFYNLADTLKQLQGIIFDLRGNSGGAEIESMRVASCFITQPVVFSHIFYGSQSAQKSATVLPGKFLNLSGLKVKILVDHKTACASEQFIYVLKKAGIATVYGAGNTAGTYANAAYFYFPGGMMLTTNVLQKSCLDASGLSLEYRGIMPDVQVKLESYRDLYGYEDKVLRTAFLQ